MKIKSSLQPNVLTAFGVLFILSGAIIPIQNLIVWGPEMVQSFYTSQDITAEKISVGVFAIGIILIIASFRINPLIDQK